MKNYSKSASPTAASVQEEWKEYDVCIVTIKSKQLQ